MDITPESIGEWVKNFIIGMECYPTRAHVRFAREKVEGGDDSVFYKNAEIYYSAYRNPPDVLELAIAYVNLAESKESE